MPHRFFSKGISSAKLHDSLISWVSRNVQSESNENIECNHAFYGKDYQEAI